jgi:hydrogenase/urease accessory protein HupE
MLSFGLVGFLVAPNARLPRLSIVSFAGVVGLLQGHSDGATMAVDIADWLSLTAVTTMAFILVTWLAALVVSLQVYGLRAPPRMAGSWLVAIGLLSLGWLVHGKG